MSRSADSRKQNSGTSLMDSKFKTASCPGFAWVHSRRRGIVLRSCLIAIMALSSGTAPVSSSNPGQNEEAQYQADASIAALLKRVEGQQQLDAQIKAMESYRLAVQNSERAKEKCAYILARKLMKGGSSSELKEAIPLFDEAANFTALWQRSQMHIAECANTLGDEALVRSSLEKVLAKTTDAALKAQVDYLLAQSYLRANEYADADKRFQEVMKIGPDTQFAIGARYYLGQSAFQSKNLKEALRYWRDYLAKCPDGRFTRDVISALNSSNNGNANFELLPSDHKLIADSCYARGDWTKALAEWRLAKFDGNWFQQGNCLLKSGKKEDGKEIFMSALTEHATDPEIEKAAKMLAFMGSKDEAIVVWHTVLDNCPKLADVALYNLAYRANGQESLDYYSELVTKYPSSEYAPESNWWLIWDKIKAGNRQAALTDLKSCLAKFEKTRQASRYSFWIGKLEEQDKHTAEAKKAYEDTAAKFGSHYYGFRARARLNALAGKDDSGWSIDFNKNIEQYKDLVAKGGWSWPTPPSAVSYKEIAAKTNSTIACLAELHQWDECLELLPADILPEFKAICLARMDLVHDAINTMAHDLHGTPDPGAKWQISYPLLHSKIIAVEAAAKLVDPFLAHALIREESRYNVYALSGSNAIGLMQLLPATAMGVAKRLGVPIKSHEDIHKPENNLKFGIDYLAYTLGRFNGKAMLAVASYNGGPNAVAGWIHKYAMDDPDVFVENIPFAETREYVRKVFGSYWNYEAIYKNKAMVAKNGVHDED